METLLIVGIVALVLSESKPAPKIPVQPTKSDAETASDLVRDWTEYIISLSKK